MTQPVKKGVATSEFWLTLAAVICGFLLSSGLIGDESTSGKVIAFAASSLTALGYSISRGMVKKAEAFTGAIKTSDTDPE